MTPQERSNIVDIITKIEHTANELEKSAKQLLLHKLVNIKVGSYAGRNALVLGVVIDSGTTKGSQVFLSLDVMKEGGDGFMQSHSRRDGRTFYSFSEVELCVC